MRLVFDLKQAVAPQIFTLKPVADYQYRLVLDLYPKVAQDPSGGHPEKAGRRPDVDDPLARILEDISRNPPGPATATIPAPAPLGPPPSLPNTPPSVALPRPSPPNSSPKLSGRKRMLTIALDPGHGGEDPGASGHRPACAKKTWSCASRTG